MYTVYLECSSTSDVTSHYGNSSSSFGPQTPAFQRSAHSKSSKQQIRGKGRGRKLLREEQLAAAVGSRAHSSVLEELGGNRAASCPTAAGSVRPAQILDVHLKLRDGYGFV